MKTNRNHWLAICLVVCALIFHIAGRYEERAAYELFLISERATPEEQNQAAELKLQSDHKALIGGLLVALGIGAVIFSNTFWFRTREKAAIPVRAAMIILMISYFLIHFILMIY